jgi:hypothetical protein
MRFVDHSAAEPLQLQLHVTLPASPSSSTSHQPQQVNGSVLKFRYALFTNCYPESFQSFIIAPIAPNQIPLSTLLCDAFPTTAGLFSITEFRIDSNGPPLCP